MRKEFVLADKTYTAKEFTFNTVCELEKMGVSLSQIENMEFSFVRAYVAYCMNSRPVVAGMKIEEHIVGGGNMSEVLRVISESLAESGFFQAMSKQSEAETPNEAETENNE